MHGQTREMTSSARSSTPAARRPVIVPSVTVVRIAWVVAVLTAFAAGVGIMWSGGTAPDVATSVRGAPVELHGVGLYRYDSVHVGASNRGTDAVALALWLPLLLIATMRYRRSSVRGALLLASTLLWLLYLYLSLALGAAYNELFLVYVALVATTSTALVLLVRSIDASQLAQRIAAAFPRRAIATFLLVTAAGTVCAWGVLAVDALLAGRPPHHLQLASTTVEEALSLGLLVPAFVLAAMALRKGDLGVGTLLGFPLLVLVAGLAPVVSAQTAAQALAGVPIVLEEVLSLVVVWVVLGAIASWLVTRAWRTIDDGATIPRDDGSVGHTMPEKPRMRGRMVPNR